jgi:hypothetical protein
MVAGGRGRSNARDDVPFQETLRRARDRHAVRLLPTFTHAMTIDLTSAAIVLDPDFGAELHSLAARMPVWIVDSPGNRAAIEAEWTRRRRDGAVRELSVFRAIDGLSPSDHLAALVRTIDAAHGPGAQDPPFRTLLVYGASPDEIAAIAVRALGGGEPVATVDGFSVAFARQKDK